MNQNYLYNKSYKYDYLNSSEKKDESLTENLFLSQFNSPKKIELTSKLENHNSNSEKKNPKLFITSDINKDRKKVDYSDFQELQSSTNSKYLILKETNYFFKKEENLKSVKKKFDFCFEKINGYIYLLFACLLGTIVNFLHKYATQNNISFITLLIYRGIFLTIFCCLFLYVYFKELKEYFDKKEINSLLIRGLVNSIAKCCILSSLNHIRLNTLELLLRTGNIMSVFLGYFLINEIVTKWDIFNLIATFFGIIFILKPNFIFGSLNISNSNSVDKPFGIFLACTCAFIVAIMNILTKKLLKNFHEVYIVLIMGISSTILGIILNEIYSLEYSVTPFFFIYILFVSILEFYSLYYTFKAIKYETITKLSPYFNSRIVFSVIITYIFHRQIDIYDLIGSIIIVILYINVLYQMNCQ